MGTLFACALSLAAAVLLRQGLGEFATMLLLGVVVVLEESAFGICIGGRFPDFRETVRSRYVSIWGSLLGTVLGLALAILTAVPVLMDTTSHVILSSSTAIGIVTGLLVFFGLWKLAVKQVSRLLIEIQV